MGNFDDFDVEIQDARDSAPEQFNSTVTTAGSPVTLTHSTAKDIQMAFIHCPSKRDPDTPNATGDAIKFSLDGGTTWTTLLSGESQHVPGVFANLKLDTNEDGTSYQVILWA